ncbi:response regulator transcription factor [Patescibacteria group bacterium]|nr:response regulator transcription factor [Patescibacteria group bacterium]MBU1501032.1 response regulator transcription factor [Patescibacteria group bacterium]MBU2080662.1 response regulator transcription factor [Patescibacteria group bacterium]MBU2124263.1 response regulator transcription factor [Patescibacteria group bacterium]MBU2194389.1 response regulator transcription factor [Patescibacteria group bacterium]
MRILIVEDEAKLAEALKRGLESKGFAVDWIAESEKAKTRIMLYRDEYDLILMDLMLPGIDGATITREARAAGVTTPIIVLTARDETEYKVELLNTGADDYLAKPFSFEELVARINAVLRRPEQSIQTTLEARDIVMDPGSRTVTKGGEPVALTLKEYSLLEYFMRHPDEALTRESILDHVWSFDFPGFSNVLDVHMKNLRKKLDTYGDTPLFETVRGVGYRLNR